MRGNVCERDDQEDPELKTQARSLKGPGTVTAAGGSDSQRCPTLGPELDHPPRDICHRLCSQPCLQSPGLMSWII